MPAWRSIGSAVRAIGRVNPRVAGMGRADLNESLCHPSSLSVKPAPIN